MNETERKIGAKFIGLKYGDVTGDGQDEALVVIKLKRAVQHCRRLFMFLNGKAKNPDHLVLPHRRPRREQAD